MIDVRASLAVLLLTSVALSAQAPPAADVARALAGTIDIHVHSLPDDRPRSVDAFEAAREAKTRGMRGLVLKNHFESTAGLTDMVRRVVPGLEVFGGIDLNRTVGGINPAAVEHMTKVTGGFGRIVWMPTFDAENQVRVSKENRPFVSISKNGALLPEVVEVIGLIAKHNLALATGHSSPAEVLLLLREGRRQGVQHMVVTHAMNTPVSMTVDQMKEAAQLGFIEFVGGSLAGGDAAARMDRFAAAIRAIGPARCVLSSDLGQPNNPHPAEGYAAFLLAMRAKGFSQAEIDTMAKQNPAQLLGLK